jgi:hypothetical protein
MKALDRFNTSTPSTPVSGNSPGFGRQAVPNNTSQNGNHTAKFLFWCSGRIEWMRRNLDRDQRIGDFRRSGCARGRRQRRLCKDRPLNFLSLSLRLMI